MRPSRGKTKAQRARGTHHSKGLRTMQLAPQGAAAGDPRRSPSFCAAAPSFGHSCAACSGYSADSSLGACSRIFAIFRTQGQSRTQRHAGCQLKVALSSAGGLPLSQAQSFIRVPCCMSDWPGAVPVIGLVEAQKHGGILRQAAWEVLQTAAVAVDHGHKVNIFNLCSWYHLISLRELMACLAWVSIAQTRMKRGQRKAHRSCGLSSRIRDAIAPVVPPGHWKGLQLTADVLCCVPPASATLLGR